MLKKEITQGSATELPFEDHGYTLTCAFDVIEHIKDDDLAIREMSRVTRSGGFVFITVPAYMFLWSDHDKINHHERRYTYRRLKEIIDTCENLEIVSWTYFNTLLFPLIAIFRLISKTKKRNATPKSDFDNFKGGTFSNKLFAFIFGIERRLLRVIKFPFGVSLMVLCRVK